MIPPSRELCERLVSRSRDDSTTSTARRVAFYLGLRSLSNSSPSLGSSDMNIGTKKALPRHLMALLVAALLVPAASSAQSAQMLSLQVSGLGAIPFGGGLSNVTAGFGWEGQLRLNPSAFSFGAGVEQTFHEVSGVAGRTIVLLGGFVEPRYVVDFGSDNAVLYISGRAALSRLTLEEGTFQSTGTGYTLNGGGGFMIRMSDRTNLDLGATIGYKDLGIVDLPAGTFDLGTGINVVARVGLAIGIG